MSAFGSLVINWEGDLSKNVVAPEVGKKHQMVAREKFKLGKFSQASHCSVAQEGEERSPAWLTSPACPPVAPSEAAGDDLG